MTATDIYTETEDVDPDALANLGPLAWLAGTWEGEGVDTHPVAEGTEDEPYLERMELVPIDPQSNGPQLLYGLRYHTRITKVGEVETFHDQVGYWLWEARTGIITQSLAIPRAQVALAQGKAAPGDKQVTVRSELGSPTNGIVSGPFLHENFRTLSYTLTISQGEGGTLKYEQDTVLQIRARPEFHHLDRATLRRVLGPQKNPLLGGV